MDASAPKILSFSLKKKTPQVEADGAAHGDAKCEDAPSTRFRFSAKLKTGGNHSSPPLPRALGFECTKAETGAPRAQALLSISEGRLEVEGGQIEEAFPRVIPCRNQLPLSDYRMRILDQSSLSIADCAEARDSTAPAVHTPEVSTNADSTAPHESHEPAAPVWGLQVKRVKAFRQEKQQEAVASSPQVRGIKSEPSVEPVHPTVATAAAAEVKVKKEASIPARSRVTDEEAAASLIAEARGERSSSRVVPLLARNSVLAEVRQKYRGEVSQRGPRQKQQAGEPDKVLLQRELELLPDAPLPGSSAYEAMPVEEFGAAMLRGMGLKDIPPSEPPVKRKAYTRAGLGSEREIDRLREKLEQHRRIEEATRKGQKGFIPLKTGTRPRE
ncbi:uncharacterized protein LOC34617987 [Cyclospora cayetanensis]|uniref:Uncharacterized protein LOC34617987 n=2 Tax=Cyclospora cayetanensis TaxID=88456 RepID=A0A6P5WDL8_9EIME|nr:uncharacterized protein LOC34617987 [Cyclospora cayetanensis]OEH77654.1 hypothetical protein cyc_00890 [Cyclospora cayetanensis]